MVLLSLFDGIYIFALIFMFIPEESSWLNNRMYPQG